MVNWRRRIAAEPAGDAQRADDPEAGVAVADEPARLAIADQPAPIAPSGPDPEPAAARWLTSGHRVAEPSRSAWLIDDHPDDRSRSSRWLIDGVRPRSAAVATPVAVLAKRRKRAVEAYCAELCPPALVEQTAADVLSAARATVGGSPTDEQLLHAAREVAGERALAAMRTRANGVVLPGQCESTPSLLAARAGAQLSEGELERFERHLSGCLPCQATELKTVRAERVFATAISGADPLEAIAPPPAGEAGPMIAPDEPAPLPGSGTQRWTAPAVAPTVPAEAHSDKRGTRRRAAAIGIAALLLIAAAATAAITLLSSGPSRRAVSTPSSIRPAARRGHTATHHAAARARHHAAARHRRTHKKRAPSGARSASAGPSTSVTTGSAPAPSAGSAPAAASAPVSNPAPAAQSSPSPASPGSGTGGSGGSGGSGGGSVAVQQGGLPAQNAPTQGIGSGGSGH